MSDVAACGTDPRPVVMARDETELLAAIKARCAELQITYETLDTAALLPDGYASKILCEARSATRSLWFTIPICSRASATSWSLANSRRRLTGSVG